MTTTYEIRDTETMTTEELRREYKFLKRNAGHGAGESEWNDAVSEIAYRLSDDHPPTPAQWVEAARRATTRCGRCRGTGIYAWGAVINGVPSHRGICFRCLGKGYQGQEDYKRNYGHDSYYFINALSEMLKSR